MRRHAILDIPIDDVDLLEAISLMHHWLDRARQASHASLIMEPAASNSTPSLHHIVTVNPEFVIAARRDAAFARVLRESALATADGVGITLAGRVLGVPIGPRVTGVDLVEGLAELSTRDERARLFLLGAGPGVAEAAAERLRERFPGVRVVGTHVGSPDDAAWREIEWRLDETRPTVLLVAFGHPAQDLWIARRRGALVSHGILVAIGVGGTFDYLSGRVPRAPRLIRRAGLEWLYRLIRQPWRWRRQLALPLFVLLVVRERVWRWLPSYRPEP